MGSPNVTYPINFDSNGNFVTSIDLPVNSATLAAGALAIKVTDTGGRIGTTNLTIASRIITLDPASSVRFSEVKVTGSGFISGNLGATITYAGASVATASPDTEGDFTTTFVVPVSAGIPSSNTVTATMSLSGAIASASATHTIPKAFVTVSPDSGEPGSGVVVTGSNFSGFAILDSITIAGVPALMRPAPQTDKDGKFSSLVIVPTAPVGTRSVEVGVGVVSALTPFTVKAPLIAPPTPTPTPVPPMTPESGLAQLLGENNLERVWNFNNTTKVWTFFDPRPAFSEANSLTQLNSNQVYWINIPAGKSLTLNGKERTLTSGWNLLAW